MQVSEGKTSFALKDCSRNDSDIYTVKVANAAGERSLPIRVDVLDTPGVCGSSLDVAEVCAEKCSLSWTPPTKTGGNPIAGYMVEKRDTSRLAWTIISENLATNEYKVT